eukprot:2609249-Ditylum_brightwellii.AAC.2
MWRGVVARLDAHPNQHNFQAGLLGTYAWAKSFEQTEVEMVADLHGFGACLATAVGTQAVASMTDVGRLFNAIC